MPTPDPSTSKSGSSAADKIKKDASAAVASAKAAAADAADEVREEIGAADSTGARVVAENARKIKQDFGAAGSELAGKAGDVATAAQEALIEMKRIMDEFAAKTGTKASEAVETVKATGADAADHLGAAFNGAGSLGKESIDGIAEAAAKRPITAMAIALGVGVLLGFASRGSSRT
ncbi:hypothetical protein [Pleomorphomonas sp. JP5]|uniref:hypothetical protein n=1 Tax=Pleomorphomonas sp. JP5 TaxID=2942998 RepID=UPI00204352F1|nr:hypothetical protein [Pleomorphomonas sp. JP5]MCM5558814.1 hypothetical protein [Pleomorphomonas sp. JP5]